jgi:hypothetical protein
MKKRVLVVLGSILLLLIVGVALAYYLIIVVSKKEVAERCQGYIPNWSNFIDCHGVIVINDAWDVDYLSLKDHVHGYEIARVHDKNQYVYVDGNIFVINRKIIEGSTSDGARTRYYQKLFQNGMLVTNYYDSVSDIPAYLIIDSESGEVRAFQNIAQVPENKQKYFDQIKEK